MPKQIRVDIKLPNSSELEKQLSSLISKLKDNKIDLGLDTKAFNGSLKEMSSALDTLKGKLKDFNVLENAIKDTSKVKSDIQEVTAEMGNLAKETKKFDSMGNLVSSTKTLKDSFTQTTKLMSDGSKTVTQDFEKLDNKIADMQSKLSKSSDNSLINPSVIDNLQNKLNSINTNTSEKEIKELQATINNLSSSDSSIVRLQNAISNLQNNLKNTRSKYGSLVDLNDLKNTTTQVNNLKSVLSDVMSGKSISSSKITSEISKANNSFKTLATNVKTSSSALHTASQDASSFGTAIQRAFGNVGIFLSTATAMRKLFTEVKNGIDYVRSLDEAFFNISATMDITKSQFEDVTGQVQQMAKDMGLSAESVMKVVQTYANASTDISTVLDKAKGSVVLSNITGMDTASVTKAVNSAVNSFKMLEEEGATATNSVERFGDVIVKTSANMQYDFGEGITEIISAIKDSGNVAYEAGMSYESYVSKMGAMIEATGRSGSELANGMKMIIARTFSIKDLGEELGVTEEEFNKAGKALQKFDINVSNGDGSLKSMDEILNTVSEKWTTMTDAEQNYLAEALAGNRQRSTMISLMNTMSKSTDLYNQSLDSSGTMYEVQEKYLESFAGKLGVLQASFESLSSNVLNSNMMKNGIDGLSGFLNMIDGAVSSFGALPVGITATITSLTLFNSKFRESVSTMTSFTPVIGGLQSKLKILEQDLIKQATAFKSQISNIKAYNNSVDKMGPPIANAGKTLSSLNTKLAITQVKLVSTKIASVALSTALSMGLSLAIGTMVSAISKGISKLSDMGQELQDFNTQFSQLGENNGDFSFLLGKYEQLDKKLKTLKEGTEEYKNVESRLKEVQDLLISNYSEKIELINQDSEAKALNIEKTKELNKEESLLATANAKESFKKNNVNTVEDIDNIIGKYKEYYNLLDEYNGKEDTTVLGNLDDAMNMDATLLETLKSGGDMLSILKENAKESTDQLEALYQATGIMATEDEKWASAHEKIGLALGKTKEEIYGTIEASGEADDSILEVVEVLQDINGDGVIDASDSMLQLAETTDSAKSAVENLGDAFSALSSPIGILEDAIKEFKEFGMVSDDTWSDIISSGNTQMIALLADNENFLKNAEELYGNLTSQQEELAQQTIRRAVEDVNASSQVVDSLNSEIQATENLEQSKSNISNASAIERANSEAEVVNNNAKNYSIDEQNKINSEDNKIRGSFVSASERMKAEQGVVDNNGKNYSIDDGNFASVSNNKIKNNDGFATSAINGTAEMVTRNNQNYATDSSNFAKSTQSKLDNLKLINQGIGASQSLMNGYNDYLAKQNKSLAEQSILYKNNGANLKIPSLGNAVSTYKGSSGVGGGVSHGNLGSGSSSGGSGSSSTKKDVENMESLADRYHDLEDAISDVNNELNLNKILQEGATGKDKIALMEKEIQLYKKQQQAIKNLIAEQKKEAEELKKSLSNQGATFDSDGDISNYNSLLNSKVNWANSLSGDAKESAIEQVKALQEQLDKYDELVNKTIPSQEQEWRALNNTIKDVYKTQAELIADMERNVSETIEYELKKRYDAKKEALNKEKELYNKEYEEANFEEEMNTERNKLAEIQAEIDKVKQDSSRAGQLRLKQLLEEYDAQQKLINDKIKEQQNQAINDRFDEEEALLDKEFEDMTSAENLSKMVADAISTGMIKIGDETINVQNSMNNMLKETEVGFANVALQQSEWLSNLEQIKTLYGSISSIMTNAGLTLPTYDNVSSSRSRSVGDISVTTGNITITGNADSSTLGSIQDMLDAQAKEIYKNIAKQLS